jgi:hypothetical protein
MHEPPTEDATPGAWSLDYDRLNEGFTVPLTDNASIRRTLQRLDGKETFYCGLCNTAEELSLITCRGEPDKLIVEYTGVLPGTYELHAAAGMLPYPSTFVLARKAHPRSPVIRVHWKNCPDVFIDATANIVLNQAEAVKIFETFYETNIIHRAFETIPKPANGYLL